MYSIAIMFFLINNCLLRQCDGRQNDLYKKLSFMISTLQDMLCSPNMDSHMSNLVRVGKPLDLFSNEVL